MKKNATFKYQWTYYFVAVIANRLSLVIVWGYVIMMTVGDFTFLQVVRTKMLMKMTNMKMVCLFIIGKEDIS